MLLRLPTLLALAASAVMAFSSAANAYPPPPHHPPAVHKVRHPAPPPKHVRHHAPPPPRAHRPPHQPRQHFRSWCDRPAGYYPQIRRCPSGWHRIPDYPRR